MSCINSLVSRVDGNSPGLKSACEVIGCMILKLSYDSTTNTASFTNSLIPTSYRREADALRLYTILSSSLTIPNERFENSVPYIASELLEESAAF